MNILSHPGKWRILKYCAAEVLLPALLIYINRMDDWICPALFIPDLTIGILTCYLFVQIIRYVYRIVTDDRIVLTRLFLFVKTIEYGNIKEIAIGSFTNQRSGHEYQYLKILLHKGLPALIYIEQLPVQERFALMNTLKEQTNLKITYKNKTLF